MIMELLQQVSKLNFLLSYQIKKYLVGGEDYHSGPYDVTFFVGINRVLLDIPVINDNTLENNENFNVTINSSSLPSYVVVGDSGQATVTILNDDGKYELAVIVSFLCQGYNKYDWLFYFKMCKIIMYIRNVKKLSAINTHSHV